MAYSTGSASGCAAVLQALATFASSNGWTVDNNAAYSGGWWLAVHKGSCYLNFTAPSTDDSITIYGATGFSSGSAPSAQAGTSSGHTFTAKAGPYAAYHFFSSSSGTYLHCMVELSSGMFAHFHGGQLNAVGGASPGIYVTCSHWNAYGPTFSGDNTASVADYYYNTPPFAMGMNYTVNTGEVLCSVDSVSRWFQFGNGTSPARTLGAGMQSSTSIGFGVWNRSSIRATPNTFNGLPVLLPMPCFAERATGSVFSMIGEFPDVRNVNMTNNNAKDEITIGTDVWKLFPIVQNVPTGQAVANGPASSYPYGLAFKKNA